MRTGSSYPPHLRRISLDSGINVKIVSDRIGHFDLGVIVQIYGPRSVGQDRESAELIAKLIPEALNWHDE